MTLCTPCIATTPVEGPEGRGREHLTMDSKEEVAAAPEAPTVAAEKSNAISDSSATNDKVGFLSMCLDIQH